MTETTVSLSALATSEQANLILEPLMAESVATNSAVATVHSTGSTEFRVPSVDSDAAAAWVSEGEEINPSGVDLSELIVIPAKVAGLVPTSTELAEDSSPDSTALIGRSLARALVDKVDQAFLGDLASPAPAGLGSLDPATVTTSLSNTDAILEAIAAVEGAGGNATGLLLHPNDALRLALLKDNSSDSNRALLENLTTVAGLNVVKSSYATEGQLWVVDANAVHTVIRSDVKVESSRDVFFSSDRIAIRASMRIAFGFPRENRLARIDVTE